MSCKITLEEGRKGKEGHEGGGWKDELQNNSGGRKERKDTRGEDGRMSCKITGGRT